MELWDIYDKNKAKTGRTHPRGMSLTEGDYHLVASVWIKNDNGEFLLTKRHPSKPHPNLWECPGGAVLAGEDGLKGALREVEEEIGIQLNPKKGTLIRSEKRDSFKDFYEAWLFEQSFDLSQTRLQQEEVTGIKWVTPEELDTMYQNKQMVHTLGYYKILL